MRTGISPSTGKDISEYGRGYLRTNARTYQFFRRKMNEKQREFVYFALSFIPLYIYHGQEERKTRKEGGQTHEQEATVRPADGLPARERQRKRVAEKDIPTTAPHHPSAEKAVHGPAGRTERGRLHHRDGAPRLPLAPTRRGDDRTVRAQKQRQELLHPRATPAAGEKQPKARCWKYWSAPPTASWAPWR